MGFVEIVKLSMRTIIHSVNKKAIQKKYIISRHVCEGREVGGGGQNPSPLIKRKFLFNVEKFFELYEEK